jgi:hypothetical protein
MDPLDKVVENTEFLLHESANAKADSDDYYDTASRRYAQLQTTLNSIDHYQVVMYWLMIILAILIGAFTLTTMFHIYGTPVTAESCDCPKPLLVVLPEEQSDALYKSDEFVDAVVKAAPGALRKPRIAKLDPKAIAKGKPFFIDIGSGMERVEFRDYEVLSNGQYKGKEFFLTIQRGNISGYFDVGDPQVIVRVESIKGTVDLVALYPLARKKVD